MTAQGQAETVLVVEDEADFRELVAFKLRESGFVVEAAGTAREGLAAARRLHPSVVILDVMLPDQPGTEIVKQLRGDPHLKDVSILMLTAKGEEIDRVVGFELGADDYVVKPCSVRELMLRVRALARRTSDRRTTPPDEVRPLAVDGLEIDPAAHKALVHGTELALTPIEFKLLLLLASNPGRAYSRERLLGEVWGITAEVTTRTVDTHVKRLREKLGPLGELIETVRGVGYRFKSG
ncbi:response regulator transcription factor [Myxococcota bacterium]|nr:response regulator transcription factor [Myxococcota bacterium]